MTDKPARLRALRASYGRELPERLAELRAAAERFLDRGLPEDREALLRRAHNLAGSAGTFGYARLSREAQRLEAGLAGLEPAPATLPSGFPEDLRARLNRMEAAALETPDTERVPEPDTPPAAGGGRTVYIVEDDALPAAEMARQLGIYGWRTRVFPDATSARAAMDQALPAALVVDLMLPEGELAGAALIRPEEQHIPTIVVSSRWDWDSRLGAVRANADAYLPKPVDYAELNERLEALTVQTPLAPFHVLIVEDSDLLRDHYALVLRAAGMRVETLEAPHRILDTLNLFAPDLILLDLYLPGCHGGEVARVIRQDSRFTDLPIMFLSTETGRQLQLAAMRTGGDDFLQKPISDADLVSAVSLRAARFRNLRELIRQDRMTGLLNHIAFTLQLEFELARQTRAGGELSTVMLDIDHFKRVNDTHGHQAGDRVIRALARLLTRRLRKTDIIGRYGGEEFAIIMADTPAADACAVIDGLREEFTRLVHHGDGQEFRCSFSAGVAACRDPGTSPDALLKRADDALYEAKRQGRNRVRRDG